MLKQIKLEEYENNLKTMLVKAKTLKDGSIAYLVTTKEGVICGIFEKEEDAKQKLPIIAYNLYRGKIPVSSFSKPKNNRRK